MYWLELCSVAFSAKTCSNPFQATKSMSQSTLWAITTLHHLYSSHLDCFGKQSVESVQCNKNPHEDTHKHKQSEKPGVLLCPCSFPESLKQSEDLADAERMLSEDYHLLCKLCCIRPSFSSPDEAIKSVPQWSLQPTCHLLRCSENKNIVQERLLLCISNHKISPLLSATVIKR